jgi:hypothetical protein
MLAVQDEQPVGTFGPNGSHQPIRDRIRLRRSIRRAQESICSVRNTASKLVVNF